MVIKDDPLDRKKKGTALLAKLRELERVHRAVALERRRKEVEEAALAAKLAAMAAAAEDEGALPLALQLARGSENESPSEPPPFRPSMHSLGLLQKKKKDRPIVVLNTRAPAKSDCACLMSCVP